MNICSDRKRQAKKRLASQSPAMQVPTSRDQWASPILDLSAHPWRFFCDPPLTKRSDGLVRLMMMDNRRRVGSTDAESTTTKGVWTLTTRAISDSRDR